jgi:threonine dehydrogenase-like Zn-dependent dehydrogenase
MQAFVLDVDGARLRDDWPSPSPREGWTRVATRMAGVCNTDLELLKGYMGFRGVLGHEFVGIALDGSLAGSRVVGGINFACHSCPACADNLGRHCAARTVLGILGADGTFAEEFAIPTRNLLRVPDTVPDHAAVFAEPLAAACEIVEQLGDGYECACLVLGDGKLGLLIAQTLAVSGYTVTLVGHHLDRLGWLEARGVSLAREIPSGIKFPLVIEATGSAAGLSTALASVRPRGTVILKSTIAVRHEIDLSPIVIDEIRLLGSRCGPFGPALALLESRRVTTDQMIDSVLPFSAVPEAISRAATAGTLKVVLEIP